MRFMVLRFMDILKLFCWVTCKNNLRNFYSIPFNDSTPSPQHFCIGYYPNIKMGEGKRNRLRWPMKPVAVTNETGFIEG